MLSASIYKINGFIVNIVVVHLPDIMSDIVLF